MKKFLSSLLAFSIITPTLFAASADATISIQEKSITSDSVTVAIQIDNPSGQAIKAVQSWIKYDPSILQGEKINTDNSPFDFVAPGENNFDAKEGIVKIGRSTLSTGVTESTITVVEVTFKRLKAGRTTLSFYNFSLGNESNTSVRVFEEGFPVNILKETPQVFTIGGTSSSTPAKDLPVTTENTTSTQETKILINGRPQNVKITSGEDYVVLSWSALKNAEGYNVYYSNRSGRYLQRRSIGDQTEYYLGGLQRGKTYYFAVTAYDRNQKETDYSNEVQITVGNPNSSSSPLFLRNSQKMLQNTKQNVESGPAEVLFLSFLIAGGVTFVFVSRRKI